MREKEEVGRMRGRTGKKRRIGENQKKKTLELMWPMGVGVRTRCQ